MRMLFGFAGGSGHLEPLVPLARAAREAGHVDAFAGRRVRRSTLDSAEA
jgi:UDP:flavonoid glycosyltransferase YjiC (YdhE family)